MAQTKPFQMLMSWNNAAEGFDFPVLPERIDIKRAGSGKDYDIVGLGKIRTIERAELAEINIESFFPKQRYPFVSETVLVNRDKEPDPNQYVNYINKWMHSGYPIRFIYVGIDAENDKYKISLPMSIESFERYEVAGQPGDIFYTLKLKEYVFYSAQKIKAVQKNGQTVLQKEPAKRPDERVPATTYTLKPGDTLMYVSRMQLGDSGRWREIQTLNGISNAELNNLPVGKVLQLPSKKE
ncbi:LysM peptidoglycan-binding domain-containing protein [Cohnella sp. JJ-181]|uniref:LysM peptidoglycan-binding domain-containing protein n=1 Tax=Cohnella rhizoplanae TaxID=2974897 RepID=UPI0023306F9E|nr:LysM peptidoglycan-binding domain-containing protein [Cohnella sp. JJ-181]